MNHSPPALKSPQARRASVITLALWSGAVLTIFVLWGTDVTLGVENVWTWPRRDLGVIRFDRVGFFLLLGSLWVIIASAIGPKLRGARRKTISIPLTVSFLFSVAIPIATIASIDDVSGLSRAPFFQYYERTSGYYWQARYEADNIADYLRSYEERLERPAANHLIGHPPGLVVLNAALIKTCSCESVQRLSAATTPGSQQVAIDLIQTSAHRNQRTFNVVDRCALWLSTLGITLVIGLTAPLIFLVGSMFVSREAAWIGAALWPFVPAVAVLFPSYYITYVPLSLLILGAWTLAIRAQSWVAAIVCGVLVTVGLWISLITAAIGFLAGLSNLLQMRLEDKRWRSVVLAHIRPLSLLLAVLIVGWLSFHFFAEVDLIEIFRLNMRNGRAFILGTGRELFPWIWLDPLITAFGFGLPVVIGCANSLIDHDSTIGAKALAWSMVTTALILGLVGLSRGEAIRHMLFVIPWVLIPVGALIDRLKSRRLLVHAMATQILSWAAVVLTIDGFHFHA